MSEQQSQKRGERSGAQKQDAARDAYAPIPPANPVRGAFGEPGSGTTWDEDVSLSFDERLARKKRAEQRRASK